MQKDAEENIKPDRPPAKILIVDDREDNLFSIETILERDGYIIKKADSGRSALKILLNEHDFSLILMDVQMPKMNGFETASLIYERDKLKHIPIIFITAHQYGEDFLFKGYELGGVDYIYKPYNPELLRYKVGAFVQLHSQTQQLVQQEAKLKAANALLQKEIEERKLSENKVNILNQQLMLNNTELKAINEELDRFAYVASHDLQEPIRKILFFADRISVTLNGSISNEVSGSLQRIVKASERMQSLVQNLLEYSRHSQMDDHFSKTDFNHIIKDVLLDLEVDIKKKQAIVVVNNLPVLQAVPSMAKQLFSNLISNALRFSKADIVPQIEIFAEQGVNENNLKSPWYNIYVKDNGIGFDPKYTDDIFVVFKRLHSYHEIAGTGIGLSICKKIVEKHKGTITAKGVVDEGATFIVGLPG
jgi:signal transduction histidine kinase